MSKSSFGMIQERVNEELLQGSTIDIYRLALSVHDKCPGLSLQAVSDLVAEAVVAARASAYWDRKTG